MIDISQTRIELSQEWPLDMNATSVEEGMGLQFLMQNGVNVVTPGTGAATTNLFAGVALSYYTSATMGVQVDYVTLNSSGAATLSETPKSSSYISAFLNPTLVNGDYVGGTQLTYVGSSPTSSEFTFSGTSFSSNSSNSGDVVLVIYKYDLSVAQSQMLVGDGVAGHTVASDVTGSIGVIQRGIVFTTMFDPTQNWGATDLADIRLSSGGIFTLGSSGASVSAAVYAVPTASSPFLGLYLHG